MQVTRPNVATTRRRTLRVGTFDRSEEYLGALERVKEWARECLELSDDEVVMVSETACFRPGCAPVQTVVTFWDSNAKRRFFRVLKPVEQVVAEDLPPAWLKDVLGASEEPIDTSCC